MSIIFEYSKILAGEKREKRKKRRIAMKALGIFFIFIMVILAIASAETIIPDSGGRLNLIGYRTCCPFAPASTAIGIALVIILFFVAKRMILYDKE
jgi:quinol-cytochrome oxidoreductase complex cytochrome b subunit